MSKLSFTLAAVTLLTLTGYLILNMGKKTTEPGMLNQFDEFNQRFGKQYSNLKEKAYRLSVYKMNLNLINEHNSKDGTTYTLGENEFADMTFEEFSAYYLKTFSKSSLGEKICADPEVSVGDIPDSLDWQAQGKVQAVKNQGMCGSCWAFSAVGALESAIAISRNELLNLSEQELVDCSKSYGNAGCNGGLMNMAYNYIAENNLNLEEKYPYKGRDQACQVPKIGKGSVGVSACVKAEASIKGLTQAIAVQPVAVAFHVTQLFMFYTGGIYNPYFCSGEPNHGVLAVGYNLSEGLPFFKVKNSWGKGWGENGYFRIAMGKETKGTCFIAGNGNNYYPKA